MCTLTREERAEVFEPDAVLRVVADLDDRPGQRHLGELVVMPERLSVGGHGPQSGRGFFVEHEVRPRHTVTEEGAEGDPVRESAVVDEQGDLVSPGRDVAHGKSVVRNGVHLVGRQHRVPDALGRNGVQGGGVDGGLGQPHSLGVASEAPAEIRDAPADLRDPVPRRGQREDRVVARHGQRVAVAEAIDTDRVGTQDRLVRLGRVPLHPPQQRRSEVEAHPFQTVHHLGFRAVVGEHATLRDRAITLVLDPFVPVVERLGGELPRYLAGPRVFPRGLIEVTVQDDRSGGWRHGSGGQADP